MMVIVMMRMITSVGKVRGVEVVVWELHERGGGVGFGGHNMKGTVFVGICEVLYSKGDNRFQR